jgi:hypothetical protein
MGTGHRRDRHRVAQGRFRAVPVRQKAFRATAACDNAFLAWATWLLVHLWYRIGFQNRMLVLIRWSFSFATHGRCARLITDAPTTSEQRDG